MCRNSTCQNSTCQKLGHQSIECQKSCPIRLFAAWPAVLLTLIYPATLMAQTVGDPFIDTSEWVQSSSPIRDQGAVRGYITETIVRGYRGPNSDRYSNDPYYNTNNFRSVTEFSTQAKIQPVVYENSSNGQATSLEPLRPTPDPVVQAANRAAVQPASATNPRGFATPASYQPVNGNVTGNQNSNLGIPTNASAPNSSPSRLIHTSYTPATMTGYPQPGYPTPNYQPAALAPTTYASTQYSYPGNPSAAYTPSQYTATQYSTPPATYASTLTNCCDPMYVQAQFVAPNMNANPGTLRTYPQYGGNPYPNPGYSISQPYVRDTWVPMIPLRSMPYGTYLGQGIIGQPVAYVDGEPVRNFLRYIFP